MKKFWLLPFLLAYVAQAAILQAAEKGSDIQVVLTGPQSNQIHLPGTAGTINGQWYQPFSITARNIISYIL